MSKNSGEAYFQRGAKGEVREFLWPGGQLNGLLKRFRKLCMMPVILMGLGKAKRWGD